MKSISNDVADDNPCHARDTNEGSVGPQAMATWQPKGCSFYRTGLESCEQPAASAALLPNDNHDWLAIRAERARRAQFLQAALQFVHERSGALAKAFDALSTLLAEIQDDRPSWGALRFEICGHEFHSSTCSSDAKPSRQGQAPKAILRN
jgi:hypothetical protein